MPNKIYTYRPYYIDSERLYDMYSTVMNGYSDTSEIIEINRHTANKRRHLSMTTSAEFVSIIRSNLFGELSSEKTSENELQRKTTRKLSPCVLLNWMIDELAKEENILETKTRWLHKDIKYSLYAIGKPVILEGYIVPNTLKGIRKLGFTLKGFKNRVRYIITTLPPTKKQKRKFFLDTNLHELKSYYLQQASIESSVADEILSNLRTAGLDEKQLSILDDISMLKNNFNSNLGDRSIQNSYWENELYLLSSRMKYALHELMQDIEKSSPNHDALPSIKRLSDNIEGVSKRLENYKELNDTGTGTIYPRYSYVFDLHETMYYSATENSILFPMAMKCLGILKKIGQEHCELEIVAIYQ